MEKTRTKKNLNEIGGQERTPYSMEKTNNSENVKGRVHIQIMKKILSMENVKGRVHIQTMKKTLNMENV